MFDELKIKYCFKNRKTGEILKPTLTISQIELQGINPNPFRSIDWTMLSREIVKETGNKMNKQELEKKVGIAFTELVAGCSDMELVALQHELRKFQPEDKNHLDLVLLELRERYKDEIYSKEK